MGEDAKVTNSIIGDGGSLLGTVTDSVIFSDVAVRKGVAIADSVVMAQTDVGEGVHIDHAIVAENVSIGEGAKIGAPLADDSELTVIGPNVCIPAGCVVEPGQIIASPEDLKPAKAENQKGGK